jgi:hypothetical protein
MPDLKSTDAFRLFRAVTVDSCKVCGQDPASIFDHLLPQECWGIFIKYVGYIKPFFQSISEDRKSFGIQD